MRKFVKIDPKNMVQAVQMVIEGTVMLDHELGISVKAVVQVDINQLALDNYMPCYTLVEHGDWLVRVPGKDKLEVMSDEAFRAKYAEVMS